MFNKSIVDKVLKQSKKKRIKALSNNLDNIVFLDFDGVINLDLNNFNGNFTDKEPMDNLNKFCLENNFKVVVISSWRKYPDYKEILYGSGLDPQIEILGKTEVLGRDRESEVIEYLKKHHYIDRFIILDDGTFNELSKYQIKTEFKKGFDDERYMEAVNFVQN